MLYERGRLCPIGRLDVPCEGWWVHCNSWIPADKSWRLFQSRWLILSGGIIRVMHPFLLRSISSPESMKGTPLWCEDSRLGKFIQTNQFILVIFSLWNRSLQTVNKAQVVVTTDIRNHLSRLKGIRFLRIGLPLSSPPVVLNHTRNNRLQALFKPVTPPSIPGLWSSEKGPRKASRMSSERLQCPASVELLPSSPTYREGKHTFQRSIPLHR